MNGSSVNSVTYINVKISEFTNGAIVYFTCKFCSQQFQQLFEATNSIYSIRVPPANKYRFIVGIFSVTESSTLARQPGSIFFHPFSPSNIRKTSYAPDIVWRIFTVPAALPVYHSFVQRRKY